MRPHDLLLRELNEQLALPVPTRTTLLREIRADFEGLVGTLLEQGHAPDEAESVARDLLIPPPHQVAELSAIHAPAYGRVTGGLSPGFLRVAEQLGLVTMTTLSVAAMVVPFSISRIGAVLPLYWMLPLLGVAGLLCGNWYRQAFRVWIRRDADVPGIVRGSLLQLGLVVVVMCVCALSLAVEAYGSAGALAQGVAGASLLRLVQRLSALGSVSLGIAVFGVFGWLGLIYAHLSSLRLQAELDELLEQVI